MTNNQTTRNKKPASPQPPQSIEWVSTVGLPRRPWTWYCVVLAIGLGLAGLFYISLQNEWSAALEMLLWTCMVIAAAFVPSRDYRAELNRSLPTAWDVKRGRAIIERNLAEFVTYDLVVLSEARLNPLNAKHLSKVVCRIPILI
jgi:hypothetical protein